jgi:hypothetical protein
MSAMISASPTISSLSKKCKKVDVRPADSSAPSQVLTSRSDSGKTPWPADPKLIKTNSKILKAKAKTSKTFYLKTLHKAPDSPLEESNSGRYSNGHFPRLFGFASDHGKVIDAELHKKFKAETLVNAKQKLQSRISKFFEHPAKPGRKWAPNSLASGHTNSSNLIGPNIKTRIEDPLIIPIELNFKSPTKVFGDDYPKLSNEQKIELIRKKSKAQKRDEIYKKNNTLTWKHFLPDLSKKKTVQSFHNFESKFLDRERELQKRKRQGTRQVILRVQVATFHIHSPRAALPEEALTENVSERQTSIIPGA